jgi:hypothetical protein
LLKEQCFSNEAPDFDDEDDYAEYVAECAAAQTELEAWNYYLSPDDDWEVSYGELPPVEQVVATDQPTQQVVVAEQPASNDTQKIYDFMKQHLIFRPDLGICLIHPDTRMFEPLAGYEEMPAGESATPAEPAPAPAEKVGTGMKPYSVLLLYPDYISEGDDTSYEHVMADSPDQAVEFARQLAANATECEDPTDFDILLVTEGHIAAVALGD